MIRELAEMHPLTASALVRIGLFSSLRRAQKRLKKLHKAGRLKFSGWAQITGRDGTEKVFCRKQIRPDDLAHDLEITLIVLGIKADEVLRYSAATISKELQPDARIVINGTVFFLEHDRDSMSSKAIRGKIDEYAKLQNIFVLWVATNESRMKKLMRLGEKIKDRSLFATYLEAVKTPHAEIWRGTDGTKASLPASRSPAWPDVLVRAAVGNGQD